MSTRPTCPDCGSLLSRVVRTRSTQEELSRRRECLMCSRRWDTYESNKPPGGVISSGTISPPMQ